MAKTTAPALSFGAGGSIAKTMVYSKWRGINYVRQHVVPANPRTAAQQSVRKTFALLREIYKLAPVAITQAWDAFAQGRPFTGMNKFVGENVRVLNGQADLTNIILSPGAKGGLPPVDMVVTSPIAGEAHVVLTLPDLPAGWTTTGAFAAAFLQQDPAGFFGGGVNTGSDLVPPCDTIDITGLATGETYVVAAYLQQTKPDGTLAYSVSISDTIVIT